MVIERWDLRLPTRLLRAEMIVSMYSLSLIGPSSGL